MIPARRMVLSAALLASFGVPALAQVELPAPPANPMVELSVPAELSAPAARLKVAADPRIELMSLLISMTRLGKQQQDDVAIAYRATAAATFHRLGSHEAVKLLEALQAQGFVGTQPYRFAMLLSAPTMSLDGPLPADLEANSEKLGALAKAIQAFAAESRFMDFHSSHGALFAAVSRKVSALLEVDDVIGRIEEFYGISADRVTIVPAPLLTSPALGIPLTHADGSHEIVCLIAPLGATGQQEPDFYQPARLFLAIETAVGQAVVSQLTSRFERDITETQELFSPLADRLAPRGITTWAAAIDQHILRAVGARMFQARGKVREAQHELLKHERDGYWYVRQFFDLLAAYQADRKTYPTLESYYPRMMATMSFWKDAGEHRRIETNAKRFMGPISATAEERYLRRTVLIRPEPKDPELRKQADAFVKRMVDRYREKFGITLPVMTSFQASAADPAQTVFLIYGTPESNAYLKALLKYVPIKVSKGDLHLGQHRFQGADLRLVTAIPNPYNPALPFRIVTGSTDEVVMSDVTMPHTLTDYVLYRGGALFRQGDFHYDEKGAWRFP